ncbi:Retrovirus-related Pol polyprotein from type-2 retrotransposable element R2DM; Endonuclease [Eumeta japonica]|uniref:Retrovirus-related Pol polyprotein from type-2 retrotransposable element R2DM Endonuclease n=1 Tax=Eumeta variegata TaxID=151549 RepID=A0A4C1WPQ8_EUMVA|nr:Retrovirus-related Pol polyprotein from type-2 retrotransposable element R2DM; Endonuclease [Eumeta japonica]
MPARRMPLGELSRNLRYCKNILCGESSSRGRASSPGQPGSDRFACGGRLEPNLETYSMGIIKEIYRGTTATIQLEQQGEEFGIEKGVRQGDPLSPKLFIAVLEDIFKNLDWEQFGININGSNLNHLRFADDIVLFAE